MIYNDTFDNLASIIILIGILTFWNKWLIFIGLRWRVDGKTIKNIVFVAQQYSFHQAAFFSYITASSLNVFLLLTGNNSGIFTRLCIAQLA